MTSPFEEPIEIDPADLVEDDAECNGCGYPVDDCRCGEEEEDEDEDDFISGDEDEDEED